jgi:hypothetical protein
MGVEVAELAPQLADERVEAAIAAARASISAKNASTTSGPRAMARSTSRQMTLPLPSQID